MECLVLTCLFIVVPLVYTPLPLGSVTPTGWLRSELKVSADGLAGHQGEFYKYVSGSSWLGGTSEYSDLNEAFPYWLNGLVPLAYTLDDARLKSQVHSAAQYVLDHQQKDGWLGPETGTMRTFWARYPLCLALIGLAEANSTWQAPVLTAMYRFNDLMYTMMQANYSGYIYHDGDELDSGNFSMTKASTGKIGITETLTFSTISMICRRMSPMTITPISMGSM
jgi:hypothetical protein